MTSERVSVADFDARGASTCCAARVVRIPEGTARSKLRQGRVGLRGALDELARDPKLVESTVEKLEGWARGLRELWGV